MITKAQKIHFVGIKGIAMAALAVWAKEAGKVVTGTDIEEHFPSDEVLTTAGISVDVGFDPMHIDSYKPDLVIYTGAHRGKDNREVARAEAFGIAVMPHGKALGVAMEGKRQITVAGSHGKTTVTAMIATILTKAGLDASYAIGSGMVAGLGLPGHYGRGEWFVAEGDEYVTDPGHDETPRFLWQKPEILVVTNIDLDHPDVYPDLPAVLSAFKKLAARVSGAVIINSDDPHSVPFVGSPRVVLVGTKEASQFHLKVPGFHNAVNAAMATAAANVAGISLEAAVAALQEFGGVKRRFEKIGERDGILFYDDYAHHPAEISATLAAARGLFPKRRIIAIFQPHTYSRTKALMDEFARSFTHADIVILTDIYPSAREHDTMGITGKTLVRETEKYHEQVRFAGGRKEVQAILTRLAHSGDVVIFMGAGDIGEWEKEVINKVTNMKNSIQKLKEKLGERAKENESMAHYTTFKIGGPADLFYDAKTTDELVSAVTAARKLGVPVLVLGGGSNILVGDGGIRGLVVKNSTERIAIAGARGAYRKGKQAGTVYVEADSGVVMNKLVRFTIEEGLGGLEMQLGLPGTVGGAMYMNSKWTHPPVFVGDAVYQATILTPKSDVATVPQSYFRFGYDQSIIQKSGDIILSVVFALHQTDKDELWKTANESMVYRHESQPQGIKSPGCTFRNISTSDAMRIPTPNHTTSAGYLVDHAGLKGLVRGDAQISPVHANFIINRGNATASDVVLLIEQARKKVKEQFDVTLKEEIVRIGDF